MPALQATTDSADAEFRGLVSGLQKEFERLQSLNDKLQHEVSSMQLRRQTVFKKDRRDSQANGYSTSSLKPPIKAVHQQSNSVTFESDQKVSLLQPEIWESKDDANIGPCGMSPIIKPSNNSPCSSPRASPLDSNPEEKSSLTLKDAMRCKTMSMAFDSGEARFKSEEEKYQKLREWFFRLSDDNDGLTAAQLRAIVERVHGHRDTLSASRIHTLVKSLEKNRKQRFIKDGIEGSHTSDTNDDLDLLRESCKSDAVLESGGATLRFQSFADLILFEHEHATSLDNDLLKDIVILRDALMRSHIDELVSHHARLPPLPEVNLPRGPSATLLRLLEPVVGAVILINGCTIGMESDIEWDGWVVLEFVFTVFFLSEILLKVRVFGLRGTFAGPDWRWNWFDASVVSLAVMDLALSQITFSKTQGFKDISLVRLARLARLTRLMRLLRVLRLRMFKELLLMVKGVVAGLRTLFWAIVMLVVLVYACGVFLRQTVGEQNHVMADKYHTVLFGSVPWAMFYTFRCFMGDCTLPDGTPVVGHMYEMYGYQMVIPYSICILFIVFGIFNMVTAVFVETVMEAAKQRQLLSKEAEARRVAELLRSLVLKLASKPFDEDDKLRWAFTADHGFGDHDTRTIQTLNISFQEHLQYLMNRMMGTHRRSQAKVYRKGEITRNLQGEVTRETFHEELEDPEVAKLIDDLEIHIGDRSELFDVLDSDGGGSLDIGELISGIMKMRSTETKQDVVALVLAVRSIRKQVQVIMKSIADDDDD